MTTTSVAQPTLFPARADNRRKNLQESVASRDEAVAKFLDAANRILHDHTLKERLAWAEKTADAYLKRGIIVIRPQA